MVLSSLFSGETSSSNIVGQVEFLILLLIVTLIVALISRRDLLTDIVYGVILVTLLGQGLTLQVLLPRWKEKLVRAEVEEPLTTQA